MSFHLYFFPIFIMTLLTAGALTDRQLPATASNVCTTDARLGGVGRVPPPTKILATPVGDTQGPSVVFEAVDMPYPGPLHFHLTHIADYIFFSHC